MAGKEDWSVSGEKKGKKDKKSTSKMVVIRSDSLNLKEQEVILIFNYLYYHFFLYKTGSMVSLWNQNFKISQ
jgi:hypothetical protein